MKVIWTNKAKNALKEIYDYLKVDSVWVAKKVKSELIASANTLVLHPNKYQKDEFYPNNPGNIRRFFKWSYRIVYELHEDKIVILMVLHASREPRIK